MSSDRRSNGRIRSGLVKARLTAFPQAKLEVLDISIRGAGVRISQALATDQEVMVEIYHPILSGAISFQESSNSDHTSSTEVTAA